METGVKVLNGKLRVGYCGKGLGKSKELNKLISHLCKIYYDILWGYSLYSF